MRKKRAVYSVPLSDNARPCAGMAVVRKEEEFLLHNGEKDSIIILAVRLGRCVGGVFTWAGFRELVPPGSYRFFFLH